MRQMRLGRREITEPDQLREVLKDCQVARIGTSDEEGMFIVPLNFGYEFSEKDGSLRLYLHCAGEGRKAEAFAKYPEVAFEMDCGHEIIRGDYACSYSYAYRSIMGNGIIHKVENTEEKLHGLRLLMQHLEPGANMEFEPEVLERVAVYRVDVTAFTGKRREKKR